MTAAHCVSGSSRGVLFAPGYYEGKTPYGTWTVQRAYVPAAWEAAQDPRADVAYLVVTPSPSNQTRLPVQAVVGGDATSHAPSAGRAVALVGYVEGRDDDPVICSATVYRTAEFPSIDCAGYAGGTSGSPWLMDYDPRTGVGVVGGVIGGLNQGGCSNDTSYTAPFDKASDYALARAIAGAPSDSVTSAGPDGC